MRENRQTQVAFMAMCIMMVLDIALGYMSAVKNHCVKSSKMRRGIYHKVGEFGVVIVGDVLDGMLLGGINMPFSAPVSTVFMVYLAFNEAVSCMENAVRLDPELGDKKFFRVLLESLKSKADGGLPDNA